VRRISVVGSSGSGKSTLARGLADRLGLAHIELDAIFHQPNWQGLASDEFRRQVAARLAGAPNGWVVCGNYSAVRPDLWNAADTIVWLDLPRHVVIRRVTVRTIRRVVSREELWNGNREPWSNLYRWDPESNVIRWSWTRHPILRHRYAAAMLDPQWAHLRFVRLCHASDVELALSVPDANRTPRMY